MHIYSFFNKISNELSQSKATVGAEKATITSNTKFK